MFLILTEDKGNLDKITGEFFESFTILPATGFWKGEKEKSVIIFIVGENYGKIVKLCQRIKEENDQLAVLLVESPSFERLI